jgi:hypothetical protein
MRAIGALLLVLAVAGCSAAQVGSAARSACRQNPAACTDAEAIPATRAPGG